LFGFDAGWEFPIRVPRVECDDEKTLREALKWVRGDHLPHYADEDRFEDAERAMVALDALVAALQETRRDLDAERKSLVESQARVRELDEAQAWLAERFFDEDRDTCEPEEIPLMTLVKRVYEWGDQGWFHAGKAQEKTDEANSRYADASARVRELKEALREKHEKAALACSRIGGDPEETDLDLLPFYEGKREAFKEALAVLGSGGPTGDSE